MNDDDVDYDVVLDVLQKHRDKLWEMTMQNMRSEFMGIGIMDQIRLDQIDQLDDAMKMWRESKNGR